MKRERYFEKYEENIELFNSYFKENAKIYWDIYKEHYLGNISCYNVGRIYSYSESSVRNILRRVEMFLDLPGEKVRELDYPIVELAGNIWMPKEFIHAFYSLSLNANKIFREAIFLYQNGMGEMIPRSHILFYSTQYKNVNRRTVLCDELRELKITLRNGTIIKVFDYIEDIKGTLRFKFTEESLSYIDPLLYLYQRVLDELLNNSE